MDNKLNGWAMAALGGAAACLAWRGYRSFCGYDFRGKTVLITGGSRGLGLVLARHFVAEGTKVAICARDAAELERAFEDLTGRGGRVVTVPCNLTVPEQVNEMVAVAEERLGPVDLLVNNAGIIGIGPVDHMTPDDFRKAMAGNFYSALHCILAVLPGMRGRRAGRIVNITSIGGKVSLPHLLPYSASKFALVGLSEGLRAELAKDGIVVTTIVPGLMRTGSPRQAEVKGQVRKELAWFSISDALPLASISAERAARTIVRAVRRGYKVILSVPAKIGVWVHGLLPGLTADALALTNRTLPAPGGAGSRGVPAEDIVPPPAPKWLTALNDRAAERNNEFAPREAFAADTDRADA
jgi:NAD(P)-dependent dehydrogenase (short-subunit alcohol dehydrogenase family)